LRHVFVAKHIAYNGKKAAEARIFFLPDVPILARSLLYN